MASSTDWARSIGTTLVLHLKEEEMTTFRKFKVFAALQANGNVAVNQGGRGFDWQVRYRNIPVTGNTGETPRVFSRQNLWLRANLPYRGYTVTDQITKREMLENRGQAQLIDVAGKMAKRLQESMEQHLSKEVFIDGSAVGNELRWHGLESMFSVAGSDGNNKTVNVADGTIRNANAADPFGAPNDEYAGLKCGLGAYAGSQLAVGSWPKVQVDPEYDFWSPLVCNYTSTFFGGATATWKDQCLEAIRETVAHAKRNDSKENQIDMILLDRSLYVQFLNRLDSRERAIVSKTTGLRSYGFSDVVEIDGIETASDYAVPPGVGYALSIGNMEMKVMTGQLLEAEGPYFNEELQAYRYAVSVLANIKMKSPRNFAKFQALA
ncbi:MAG: hypothetical protein EBR88_00325 [Betaproteobacteria bacterium]|nr:hypothetical protein [Betaproteobacteria bacterium]